MSDTIGRHEDLSSDSFQDQVDQEAGFGLRIFALSRWSKTGQELEANGSTFGDEMQQQAFAVTAYHSPYKFKDVNNHGLDHAEAISTVLTNVASLVGSDHADVFLGSTAGDSVDGGAGDDWLAGRRGNDFIVGGEGDDRIAGGEGEDTIIGDAGNDNIGGGAGDDIIASSDGHDKVRGSEGVDTFIFTGNAGQLVIMDFDPSSDILVVDTRSLEGEVDNLLDLAVQNSFGNVKIHLGDGQVVTLRNVDLADLKESNIVADQNGVLTDELLPSLAPKEIVQPAIVTEPVNEVIDAGAEAYDLVNLAEVKGVNISGINASTVTGSELSLASGSNVSISEAGYFVEPRGTDSSASYSDIHEGVDGALEFGSIVINARELVGTEFKDIFLGRDFADWVSFGGGDDFIQSGGGNDVIDGGSGGDYIDAGSGDDVLFLSTGTDNVTGGSGRDLFIVRGEIGETVLRDFDPEKDKVRIELADFDNFQVVLDNLSDEEDGAVLTLPDGGQILFRDVTADQLDSSVFVLPNASGFEGPLVFEASRDVAPLADTSDTSQSAEERQIEISIAAKDREVAVERDQEGVMGDFSQFSGLNLHVIADYAQNHPFVNLFKTSRRMFGHAEEHGWGGVNYDDLVEMDVFDDQGYPTFIPDSVNGGISALLLTDADPSYERAAGTFRLTYEGEGEIQIRNAVPGSIRYEGDGTVYFDYAGGKGNMIDIRILSTDPEGSGDYIRDIAVVHEDFEDLHDAGVTFNPDFIDMVEDFSTLRFMDWSRTNIEREDPALVDKDFVTYTDKDGVPLEVMIELANQVGSDPWITIPHNASDEYIRQVAEYIEQNLDPNLEVYVEYSNEVWNWQFTQTHYADAKGKELFPDADAPAQAYYGFRSTEVAVIFEEVFGDRADTHLHNVLATQVVNPWITSQILKTPVVVNGVETTVGQSGLFESVAGTTYFGHRQYHDALAEELGITDVKDTSISLSDFTDEQIDGALQVLSDIVVNEIRSGTHHAGQGELAEKYGLEYITYEGGSHVLASPEYHNIPWIVEILEEYNYSSYIADAYHAEQEMFQAAGGTLDVVYEDVRVASKYGYFGHWRYIGDENARTEYLESLRSDNPIFTSDRQAADFDQGITELGTDGDDRFVGTGEEDFLAGGKGDDSFDLSAGGNDHVHGGEGVDRLVLSGSKEDYSFSEDDKGLVTITDQDGRIVMVNDVEEFEFQGGVVYTNSELW